MPMPPVAPALLLDEAALGHLRQLDPDGRNGLLRRVFETFEGSMARLLPALAVAGRGSAPADLDAVRFIVHTLKSSSAIAGALEMSRRCADIEAMAKEQRTVGLSQRVDELLAEASRVRAALRERLAGED